MLLMVPVMPLLVLVTEIGVSVASIPSKYENPIALSLTVKP